MRTDCAVAYPDAIPVAPATNPHHLAYPDADCCSYIHTPAERHPDTFPAFD